MQRTYDKDPYAILGIPPTATASQVKQAYHRLARQFHPDLNKDPRAVERMKDINWANSILSDAQERSFYDMWRNSNYWYSPGANPPPPRAASPRSSPRPNPPRTAYTDSTVAQNPRAQGCSTTVVAWIVVVMLVNIVRSIGSVARPSYNYPTVNNATQTAEVGMMISVLETRLVEEGISTSIVVTPQPAYQTLFASSPTAGVLRDEYGHEDLRPGIVPGSQEWEWIDQYFPELTTPDGLSDEVTFVYWDQLQRAIIIETQHLGKYIISIYGGTVIAGHDGPDARILTASATLSSVP